MEFVIFGDMHFYKNYKRSLVLSDGNTSWLQQQMDVIKQIFDYAKKHNIKTVIHNGDLFEEKYYISQDLYNRVWKLFRGYSKEFDIILNCGNHDIATLSGASSLYPMSDFVKFVIEPTVLMSTHDELLKIIPFGKINGNLDTTFAKMAVLITHENIDGLEYGQVTYSDITRLNRGLFREWNLVLNNHIHKPQQFGNIVNVGSPMIVDYGEEGEEKRFIHYKDGEIISVPLKCSKFNTLDVIPKDGIDDEYNYYRIKISKEELSDPIFKRFNVEPYIVKSVKREMRIDSEKSQEEKLKSYIELKDSTLNKNKLLKVGLKLLAE